MNSTLKKFLTTSILISIFLSVNAQQKNDVFLWLTKPDRSSLFAKQDHEKISTHLQGWEGPTINVDQTVRYQIIDGFGFALTGGSAFTIFQMKEEKQKALLSELFDTTGNSIGISYLRVSIGSSDLNVKVFSYDDMPPGEQDTGLRQFSLSNDTLDVIPILKKILAINPSIKILASPWSAPTWMKTNNNSKGGKLKPEFYKVYADYFVKYIQNMKIQGIKIDAITVQNEPLHDGNNPSMKMLAEDQKVFIRDYLGPAFKLAGITTNIIIWDHNCDVPEYPITILRDTVAAKYIDGSGFHLYGGKIEALSEVHNAYCNKNIYFTEQMVVEVPNQNIINIGVPIRKIIIGATNNWSKNIILWNLAADKNNDPHTDNGGCSTCQGAITIDGSEVTRNLGYYTIAHASKFVRPGSVRINSTEIEDLPNVSFLTPDGKKVLIVLNNSWISQNFLIHDRSQERLIRTKLDAGAVGTYIW